MCDQENPSNVALKNPVSSDAAELSDTSSLSDSDPEDSATHFRAEVENLSSSGDSSPDRAPLGACGRSGPRKLPFQLQGGSADFSSRSQSIFLRPMPLLPQRKREEKREGVAGRPPPTPPSSAAGVPESPTHSPRWTKYSLEDVPETSERKNSQVALEYIQGLQQRRRESQTGEEPFVPAFNQDHSSRGDSKILFSRPGRRDEGQAARDKAHEGCASEGGKKKEVGLFHLEEPEEDPKSAEPSKGPRKRNCAPEEEEEDDGQPQSAVGFNSGRKVNRKKFRRGGEQEEEEN
ncbi:hypothetical protein COCON_G00043070 [Conger conger]|uniref:Protein TSSC4 n=1 Tax=Conger conger TaxID=82655 RepID=A0A9Q1I4X2_CONCO|nr:hypothetical protein COCON_G00043070 [Conger conger]